MDLPVRTRVSAYAVAVEDGRLLLARLSDASPVFTPGLWHLPGGGIDRRQPVEALARELQETGLELVAARLLDARTYAVHGTGSWHLTGLFYAVDPVGERCLATIYWDTAVRYLGEERAPGSLHPSAAVPPQKPAESGRASVGPVPLRQSGDSGRRGTPLAALRTGELRPFNLDGWDRPPPTMAP
ncbi:hypothetical protein SCYAM73S_01341 [Streptomyces cyaneofuscatus]